MKELIERIFSYHECFYKDSVFNSLKKQLFFLLENIPANEILISLGSGYKRDEELENYKNVIKLDTKNEEESLNVLIEIDSDEYSYMFEIMNGEVSFGGHYYDDNLLLHCETYEYKKEGSSFKLTKTIEVIDRNDYYFDYSIDITYFDESGECSKKESEEDEIFSEKFGIPLLDVSKYRSNFKENRDYLNECKVKSEMEYEDNVSCNESSFTSPFNMSDFALVFNFDYETNEDHLYKAMDFLYTVEDLDEAGRRLNFLKKLLESIIGYDSLVVIEENLYLNIAAYVYNSSTEFLTTRGRIIKKVNGELIMYVIEITSNKTTFFAKILTKEEATKLYYNNAKNLETDDLKEFLEIDRILN